MTTSPDNTSRMDTADALLFLAESMGPGGAGGAIERMEADGQRQLVNSQVIPTDINHGTDADLTDLGFVLGDFVDDDPLFRHATLPDGWTRQAADHPMWSYLRDPQGRERAAIFYKAAFYDRDAFLSVTTLHGYVSQMVNSGERPVLDDSWATRESVLAELEKIRAYEESEERQCAEFAGQEGENSDYWNRRAGEHRDLAERCIHMIATLARETTDAG